MFDTVKRKSIKVLSSGIFMVFPIYFSVVVYVILSSVFFKIFPIDIGILYVLLGQTICCLLSMIIGFSIIVLIEILKEVL